MGVSSPKSFAKVRSVKADEGGAKEPDGAAQVVEFLFKEKLDVRFCLGECRTRGELTSLKWNKHGGKGDLEPKCSSKSWNETTDNSSWHT